MLYKTVVMELLEGNDLLRERLRAEGSLLASLELMAGNLRERHRELVAEMQESPAVGGFREISSAALEIAVREIQDRMTAFLESDEKLDLDAIMQNIARPSPVE
ncbi:MAG: hypothetical protein R3C59_09535 [Planctomycetaceae bacterium]